MPRCCCCVLSLPPPPTPRALTLLSLSPLPFAVDVVHKFARAAHAAGFAAVRSRDTLQSIVDTFCQQRTCTRPTVEESIALTIDGVGVITVLPWIEPADVVEELAVLSAKGGNALTATNLEEIMTHFCTRVLCDPARLVARLPLIDLSLTLEGIGRVEVPATAEPADLVERFAEEAEKAGVKFGRAEIDAAMGYFCARRPCARGVVTAAEADMLAGKSFDPITLSVEGYGTATVGSTQEPADVRILQYYYHSCSWQRARFCPFSPLSLSLPATLTSLCSLSLLSALSYDAGRRRVCSRRPCVGARVPRLSNGGDARVLLRPSHLPPRHTLPRRCCRSRRRVPR